MLPVPLAGIPDAVLSLVQLKVLPATLLLNEVRILSKEHTSISAIGLITGSGKSVTVNVFIALVHPLRVAE
jgi:hypothetical protein